MKKFNLGESKVCFDNNFEFYHPIYISMIKTAQELCDDFKKKLDSIKDLDEFIYFENEADAKAFLKNMQKFILDNYKN